MKLAYAIFYAILFALPAWGYTSLSADSVHNRIVNCDTFILLDVREWSEYTSGHISEPAGQLPLTPVSMPWSSGVLSTEYNNLPRDVDIIVYCASGGRSASASAFLDGQGFTRIYNMIGGFNSWTYESRTGGYGDHTGIWIHPTDTATNIVINTETGDTNSIVFPVSALPITDSIYIELHFASPYTPIPPDVPVSDISGLFRITVLNQFGLSLFESDSFVLADTVNINLSPIYHTSKNSNMYMEDLKVFIPSIGWNSVPYNFAYPIFHRAETVLHRWYNAEGYAPFSVKTNVFSCDVNLNIYPNPFNSICKISIRKQCGIRIEKISIYNLYGNMIYEKDIENQVNPITNNRTEITWKPNTFLSSGIYIVNIKDNFGNIYVSKILYMK